MRINATARVDRSYQLVNNDEDPPPDLVERDVFRFGTQDVLTGWVNTPLLMCWQSLYSYSPGTADVGWSAIVGTLTLTGPSGTNVTCTLGVRCRLQIAGSGFSASNGIRLMELDVPCGSRDFPTFDFGDPATSPYVNSTAIARPKDTPGSITTAPYVAVDPYYQIYDLYTEVIGPLATYQICWGYEPKVTLGCK